MVVCRNQVFFIFWQITQDLNKLKKKNPEHICVDIGKQGKCGKCQQKILKSMVVGACQSCKLFRQNTWFLQNNRALSKFLYEILHYLISVTKL